MITKLDNHMTEPILPRTNHIQTLLTWYGNQLPRQVLDIRENGLWLYTAKPELQLLILLLRRTTLEDNVLVQESIFA